MYAVLAPVVGAAPVAAGGRGPHALGAHVGEPLAGAQLLGREDGVLDGEDERPGAVGGDDDPGVHRERRGGDLVFHLGRVVLVDRGAEGVVRAVRVDGEPRDHRVVLPGHREVGRHRVGAGREGVGPRQPARAHRERAAHVGELVVVGGAARRRELVGARREGRGGADGGGPVARGRRGALPAHEAGDVHPERGGLALGHLLAAVGRGEPGFGDGPVDGEGGRRAVGPGVAVPQRDGAPVGSGAGGRAAGDLVALARGDADLLPAAVGEAHRGHGPADGPEVRPRVGPGRVALGERGQLGAVGVPPEARVVHREPQGDVARGPELPVEGDGVEDAAPEGELGDAGGRAAGQPRRHHVYAVLAPVVGAAPVAAGGRGPHALGAHVGEPLAGAQLLGREDGVLDGEDERPGAVGGDDDPGVHRERRGGDLVFHLGRVVLVDRGAEGVVRAVRVDGEPRDHRVVLPGHREVGRHRVGAGREGVGPRQPARAHRERAAHVGELVVVGGAARRRELVGARREGRGGADGGGPVARGRRGALPAHEAGDVHPERGGLALGHLLAAVGRGEPGFGDGPVDGEGGRRAVGPGVAVPQRDGAPVGSGAGGRAAGDLVALARGDADLLPAAVGEAAGDGGLANFLSRRLNHHQICNLRFGRLRCAGIITHARSSMKEHRTQPRYLRVRIVERYLGVSIGYLCAKFLHTCRPRTNRPIDGVHGGITASYRHNR